MASIETQEIERNTFLGYIVMDEKSRLPGMFTVNISCLSMTMSLHHIRTFKTWQALTLEAWQRFVSGTSLEPEGHCTSLQTGQGL